jgi:hypothetical protein
VIREDQFLPSFELATLVFRVGPEVEVLLRGRGPEAEARKKTNKFFILKPFLPPLCRWVVAKNKYFQKTFVRLSVLKFLNPL